MTRIEKLIERLKGMPKDFTYGEACRVLSHLGYVEVPTGATSGSRRRFVSEDGNIITIHEPHPSQELKAYVVRELACLVEEVENEQR